MRKAFRDNEALTEQMASLLKQLYREFGWITRLIAPRVGCFAHFTLKSEEARLAKGWTWEPYCFYEKNPAVLTQERAGSEARQRQPEVPPAPVSSSPIPTMEKRTGPNLKKAGP
jgi:hypothetical protein